MGCFQVLLITLAEVRCDSPEVDFFEAPNDINKITVITHLSHRTKCREQDNIILRAKAAGFSSPENPTIYEISYHVMLLPRLYHVHVARSYTLNAQILP